MGLLWIVAYVSEGLSSCLESGVLPAAVSAVLVKEWVREIIHLSLEGQIHSVLVGETKLSH